MEGGWTEIEGEGEVPLPDLYEKGFSYIATAKKMKSAGDLQGAYAHYLQGTEVFFSVARREPDKKRAAVVKSNLKQFICESEALKAQIAATCYRSSVDSSCYPHPTYDSFSAAPMAAAIPQPMDAAPAAHYYGSHPAAASRYSLPMAGYPSAAMPAAPPMPASGYGHGMGVATHGPMPGAMPFIGTFGHRTDTGTAVHSVGTTPDPELDSEAVLALLDMDLPAPPKGSPPKKKAPKSAAASSAEAVDSVFGSGHPELKRGEKLLDSAVAMDRAKDYESAMAEYLECAKCFMKAVKSPLLAGRKHESVKKSTRSKLEIILGRIEVLKKQKTKATMTATTRVNAGVSGESLTPRELAVLRKASFVRHMTLYPWMPADEVSSMPGKKGGDDDGSFKDPHGMLPLAENQRARFGKWRRITNIAKGRCKIVDKKVTPYCIKQTLIGDCSFVSSMTVAALYELRFSQPLVTSLIYPQSADGKPQLSPSGRYFVKLFLNGCFRKIEIDDYLPVSKSGSLLCSFSIDPNEFWVSLLEKAFLKVMGGYDFPGSNSAEDLHCLTGWVPERVSFKDMTESDKTRLWERLVSGHKHGDCLITTNTQDLDDAKCEELGLVKTHAYAVLRVEAVGEQLFLLLKNPWSHKRWKGRYSAEDLSSWTPSLRKALGYDPTKEACKKDTGIFWIEFDDLVQCYTSFYLSWRPELFRFRIAQHWHWPESSEGPRNDTYNLGYNPQFLLDIDLSAAAASSRGAAAALEDLSDFDGATHIKNVKGYVWIVLSKHMESTKRAEQSKDDFLTVHVFNADSNPSQIDGRIFHRNDCFMNGTYINSMHYLVRLDVDRESVLRRATHRGTRKKGKVEEKYTIVVSQFEKKHDVSFTMTCYSTVPCRFRPVNEALWKYKRLVTGAWTASHSGGSRNHDSFPRNPQFRIVTTDRCNVRLMLEAPHTFNVKVAVYRLADFKDPERVDLERRLADSKSKVAERKRREAEAKSKKVESSEEKKSEAEDGGGDEDVEVKEDGGGEEVVEELTEESVDVSKVPVVSTGKIMSRADFRDSLLAADSGAYRAAVAVLDLDKLPNGAYVAILSTFEPSKLGAFRLTVRSSHKLGFTPV